MYGCPLDCRAHFFTLSERASADRTFVNNASYHGDTFESLIITKTGGKEFTTRQKGRRVGNYP